MSNPSDDRPPLLILGASARAAASSAWRAGFDPVAVDLFADRDLAARFPCRAVARDGYPRSLFDAARSLPASPWMDSGGLENHPGLVDGLARERPLLGIGGDALAKVRDPVAWSSAVGLAGLPTLAILAPADAPPTSGGWLRKAVRSTGGRGVRPWPIGPEAIPPGHLLQSRRAGMSLGAIFVGDGRSARLRGVTRHLLGLSPEGLRVVYRGSVGPWPLSGRVTTRIGRIGATLADAFGLRGLFGVDLILDGETPWPVEINPRYTASVEVLEGALGLTLVAEHARAFGHEMPEPSTTPSPGAVAKRILFATRRGVAPLDWPWTDPAAKWPDVADLPAPGAVIEPGDPVLTVFGRGATVSEAMARLRTHAQCWRRRINGWSSP